MPKSDRLERLFSERPEDEWSEILIDHFGNKPNDLQAYFQVLQNLRRTGNRQKVLTLLRQTPDSFKNKRYDLELCSEYLHHNTLQHAEEVLLGLEEKHGKDFQILLRQAQLHKKKGKIKAALELLLECSTLNPQNKHVFLQMARLHTERKDWNPGITAVNQALDIDGQFFPAHIQHGIINRHMGQHVEAIRHFKKAMEHAPHIRAKNNAALYLAEEKRHLGLLNEAKNIVLSVLVQNHHKIRALLILASIYQREENYPKALEAYEKLLHQDNNHRWAIRGKAQCLAKIRDSKTVIDYCSLVTKTTDDPVILQILSKTYLADNQFPQALHWIDKAIEHEARPAFILLKSKILTEANNINKAIQLLEKSIKSDPAEHRYHQKLYHLHSRNGNYKQALEHTMSARELAPHDLRYPIWQAQCFHRLGHIARAQSLIESITSQDLDYPAALHLGFYYRLINRNDLALETFKHAMTLATKDTLKYNALYHQLQDLVHLGAYEEALALLHSIPKNHKTQKIALIEFQLESKSRSLEESLDALKHIESNYSASEEFHLAKAKILYNHGQYSRALQCLKLLSHLEKHSVFHLYTQVLSSLDREREVIKLYSKRISQNPKSIQLIIDLTNFLIHQNFTASAEKVIASYHAQMLESEAGKSTIARQYFKTGQIEKCRQLVDQAKTQYPEAPAFQSLHLALLKIRGEYREAIDYIDKLTVHHSGHRRHILRMKADCLMCLYDYHSALRVYRSIISPKENNTPARLGIVLCSFLLGDLDTAQKELQDATSEIQHNRGQKVIIPYYSHPGKLIQETRAHPTALKAWQTVFTEKQEDNLLRWSKLVLRYPSYIPAAIQLMRAWRLQHSASESVAGKGTSIPRTIIQFWDNPDIPKEVSAMTKSWTKLNPQFSYALYSWEEAHAFILKNYDTRHHEAFLNCKHPAEQSDYFRLAYLALHGGVYADADDKCVHPITKLISQGDFIVSQEYISTLANNFIAVRQGHPIITNALESATEKLNDYTNESAWFKTGPGLLTQETSLYIAQNLTTQNAQNLSHLRILSGAELRDYVWPHIPMPYKSSDKSWFKKNYLRRIKSTLSQNEKKTAD